MKEDPDATDDHDDDDDPLAEIRVRFVKSLDDWKRVAVEHAADGDADALRAHCHRIKGTSAVLGFRPLADAGIQAEAALKEILASPSSTKALDKAIEAVLTQIDLLKSAPVPSEL